MIPQIAPMGRKYRISSDDNKVWPLRNAEGLTFAEAKAARDAEAKARRKVA